MPDQTQQTVDPGGQSGGSLSQGTRIPIFKPGRGRPSPWVSEDLNKLVKVCNAFLGLRVNVIQSPPPDNATLSPMGWITLTEDSATLTIYTGNPIASGGGGGSTLMEVFQEFDDYVECVDPNGDHQNVAKPWWLRRATYTALSPWTGPDAVHTYTYVSAQKRTDSTPDPSGSGTLTEDAIIYPPYVVGSTFNALQPTGGTDLTEDGNPVIYADANDNARVWKNNTQICYKGGYAAYMLTDSQPYINSI